jgi:hypothetical protein
MKLEICGVREITHPKPEEIEREIMGLDTSALDAFLILSSPDGRFVQTTGDVRIGFHLEYQDGGLDRHFRASGESVGVELVIKVFCAFATGETSLEDLTHWEKMEI